MSAPAEGTRYLPQDAGNSAHTGVWNDSLNGGSGGYLDVRGTPQGYIIVTNPDGSLVGASNGAVTLADGADTTLGAKADGAWTGTGSASAIALLKGLFGFFRLGQGTRAQSLAVTIASDQTAVASSVADGGNVALGTTTDSAYVSGNGTTIALLKGLFGLFKVGPQGKAASLAVTIATDQPSISTTPLPTRGASTDRSGTLTTGGTAQQIAAANASRVYLFIQNQSTGNLWIQFGTTAVQSQPSILLGPNGDYESPAQFVETGLVSIIGATTGQAWAAREF